MSPQFASPYLDDPWRRLAWITPLSVLVWAAALFSFSILLRQTAPPAPEPNSIEAQIVELPPMVGGLKGGPAAAAHPAAPAPPKPKPRVEVKHKVLLHKERVIPMAPPSLSGTRRAPAESPPAASTTASKAATTSESAGGSGVPQGRESTGGGAGPGSDNLGARAIYCPIPKIPDDLRDMAVEAEAMAHFEVSYDGKVTVTLSRPTRYPRLNQILLSTLEQWRFFPAMKGGVAIDSAFDVRIPISIE